MLSLERTENTLNETLHKLGWHDTSRKDIIDNIDVHRSPPKYQVKAFPNTLIKTLLI